MSGHGLVSTTTIAKLLGVSESRVRQLSSRSDFPKPLDIPGLAGKVYRLKDIALWVENWDRGAIGGRPSKGRGESHETT